VLISAAAAYAEYVRTHKGEGVTALDVAASAWLYQAHDKPQRAAVVAGDDMDALQANLEALAKSATSSDVVQVGVV
jgi:hypothetical protein